MASRAELVPSQIIDDDKNDIRPNVLGRFGYGKSGFGDASQSSHSQCLECGSSVHLCLAIDLEAVRIIWEHLTFAQEKRRPSEACLKEAVKSVDG
jgi:hypothetical protein